MVPNNLEAMYVQVISHLQTSNPDVYAVGDLAAFPLKKYNIVTRQEHVANARASAQHAVSHILSPDSVSDYDYSVFFYSRSYDLGWQVGIAPPRRKYFFQYAILKR